MVTLPKDGVATWEDAKYLLETFPNNIEAYIHLNVEVDSFLPAEAKNKLEAEINTESKAYHQCIIAFDNDHTVANAEAKAA